MSAVDMLRCVLCLSFYAEGEAHTCKPRAQVRSNAAHVPSCQCELCKPAHFGSALQPDGERFGVRLELAFEIDAADYYTARRNAEAIAQSIAVEVSKAVPAAARVLDVERKT